jgi:cytochrome c oxidase subunit 2
MYGRVIGMRMEDYRRWYADKVKQVEEARTGAARQYEALQEQQSGEGGGG